MAVITPTAGRTPAWAWVGEVAFQFDGGRAPLVLHGDRPRSPDATRRTALTSSGPPFSVSSLLYAKPELDSVKPASDSIKPEFDTVKSAVYCLANRTASVRDNPRPPTDHRDGRRPTTPCSRRVVQADAVLVGYLARVRIRRVDTLLQVHVGPEVDLERAFPVNAGGKDAHARQIDWRTLAVEVQDRLVHLLQHHHHFALSE